MKKHVRLWWPQRDSIELAEFKCAISLRGDCRSARPADGNDPQIAGMWCDAVDQRPDPHHVFAMAAPVAN